MTPKFTKGEKVKTDNFDDVGYVVEIVERPEVFQERYKYLVEFDTPSGFLRPARTKQEWIYETMLDKFIN